MLSLLLILSFCCSYFFLLYLSVAFEDSFFLLLLLLLLFLCVVVAVDSIEVLDLRLFFCYTNAGWQEIYWDYSKKKFKEFVSTFERQFAETLSENWFELSYSYIFWSLVYKHLESLQSWSIKHLFSFFLIKQQKGKTLNFLFHSIQKSINQSHDLLKWNINLLLLLRTNASPLEHVSGASMRIWQVCWSK